MFFLIRTRLIDGPGSLARLAQALGEAGVNILAVQTFPDLGGVTDEVVVRVPPGVGDDDLLALVAGSGGLSVRVVPTDSGHVSDQTLRWLGAAKQVLEAPERLPDVLGRLLGEERSEWSATEHVRAEVLADLADLGRPRVGRSRLDQVEHVSEPDHWSAAIAGHVVGSARIRRTTPEEPRIAVEVAPAWRRLGIGSRLLRDALAALAAEQRDAVVVAPADDEAMLPFLSANNVRGLIRISDGELQVRVTAPTSAGRARPA